MPWFRYTTQMTDFVPRVLLASYFFSVHPSESLSLLTSLALAGPLDFGFLFFRPFSYYLTLLPLLPGSLLLRDSHAFLLQV